MVTDEILGILGQGGKRRLLFLHPFLQDKHVPKLGPAMLAHVMERQLADLHPMHDERPRHAKDGSSVIGTDLLVLSKNCDSSFVPDPMRSSTLSPLPIFGIAAVSCRS